MRCTSAMGMVITAVLLHKQRELVQVFEQAGATSVDHARTAEQLGLQLGMAWHRLMAQAVLRCPAEGRYFLDRANWQRRRRRRRSLALAFIAGLLLLLGLVLIFSHGG